MRGEPLADSEARRRSRGQRFTFPAQILEQLQAAALLPKSLGRRHVSSQQPGLPSLYFETPFTVIFPSLCMQVPTSQPPLLGQRLLL